MSSEKNSITFLGTGTSTGVPQLGCDCFVCHSADERDKRLRSSAMVEMKGHRFLIDTTPDMRQQLLSNHITNIDAIFITHYHYDHLGGLDDVRPLGTIDLYAEKCVNDVIKTNMPYCFGENLYPGVPRIILHEINECPFQVNEILVTPVRVLHAQLPILGYRLGDLAYLTDVKKIDEKELEKLKGLKILVLNALRKTEHKSHISLSEAIELAEKIGAEKTYFTHASHEIGLHKDIEKILPKNMFYAYDNLRVEF